MPAPSPSRPWLWHCCAPSLRAQRLSCWHPSQGSNTDYGSSKSAPPPHPFRTRGGNDSPWSLVPRAAPSPRPAHTPHAPFITLFAMNPQEVPSASGKDPTDPSAQFISHSPPPPWTRQQSSREMEAQNTALKSWRNPASLPDPGEAPALTLGNKSENPGQGPGIPCHPCLPLPGWGQQHEGRGEKLPSATFWTTQRSRGRRNRPCSPQETSSQTGSSMTPPSD